jgi:hypothetical protein
MTTKYMFGIEISKDYCNALCLDKINSDTKWHDCTFLEIGQLTNYRNFEDLGLMAPTPQGNKHFRVDLVHAVKHNRRLKAPLVTDGHLTDLPLDSVYSSVESLKGLRSVICIAELNQLPIWNTDINAYLI